ncbi:MAG: polymerase primary sigma factor [Thermoleophilaceae bacterium]|nr:polymerase primary sigma factor [Thermoleophilaceae bacterium]
MALPVRRGNGASRPVQRSEPFRELEALQQRTAELMQSRWSGAGLAATTWTPRVDIEETGEAWVVETDLPGVRNDDIDVEVRDDELEISGDVEERERRGVLRRRMRRVGRFELRVTLPGPIDAEQMDAHLNDGVLTLRMPKPEQARPRRIEVKGGGVVGPTVAGAPTGFDADSETIRAAKAGEGEARAELLDAFMPLIGGIARIYRDSPAVDRAELMQEGVVGLLRALERYDPELGTPFWGYAAWWVRQAMQHLVAELTWPVVLSDRALRQLARINRARQRHLQTHGREPTIDELANATGLLRRQVEDLVVAERRPRGLDEPVGSEEGAYGTFGDLMADPVAEEAYDAVPTRLVVRQLPRLLGRLSDRERAVVCGHFGLGGRTPRTLRELGESLGVSAERARQIERGALDKLRAATDRRGTVAAPPTRPIDT